MSATPSPAPEEEIDDDGPSACVMAFNANDPSGGGGTSADLSAIASVGAHALPVVTGVYARDTSEMNFQTYTSGGVTYDAAAQAAARRPQIEIVSPVGHPLYSPARWYRAVHPCPCHGRALGSAPGGVVRPHYLP